MFNIARVYIIDACPTYSDKFIRDIFCTVCSNFRFCHNAHRSRCMATSSIESLTSNTSCEMTRLRRFIWKRHRLHLAGSRYWIESSRGNVDVILFFVVDVGGRSPFRKTSRLFHRRTVAGRPPAYLYRCWHRKFRFESFGKFFSEKNFNARFEDNFVSRL